MRGEQLTCGGCKSSRVYAGEAAQSLAAIERDGVNTWEAAQKRRWSCPNCGTRFTWYQRRCRDCGKALGRASYEIAGLRKLVCKIVFDGVCRKRKSRRPDPNV